METTYTTTRSLKRKFSVISSCEEGRGYTFSKVRFCGFDLMLSSCSCRLVG